MDKFDPNSIDQGDCGCWGSGSYETGSTRPPKDRSGALSACLVAAIVLVSLLSALRLMRIPVLLQLHQPQPTEPALFTPAAQSFENLQLDERVQLPQSTTEKSLDAGLGLRGHRVPPVMQYMYHIPDGLYLTEVHAHSDAARQGLKPGDVLISLDGTVINAQETLDALLAERLPGEEVSVQIYSDHRFFQLQLKIAE